MVGLTGGIGSGKSTVAALLAERGAVVIDADRIAREVVEPGTPAFDALVERFGPDIVAADGALDRPALAAKAFATDEARADLEAITHPAIAKEFLRRVAESPPDAIVVHDVPLLAESKSRSKADYDAVIVVEAPRSVRLDRLEARGVTRPDAEARMAAQASDEQRREMATWVVENGGTLDELRARIDTIWSRLDEMRRSRAGEDQSGASPSSATT
jgi:dephospho-CoA kinase